MKKINKVLILTLVLALSVGLLVGCGNKNKDSGDKASGDKGKKIVWKLGHLGNDEHMWQKTALKFAEIVSDKTDGQLEIKVYPNEQLGGEVDNINMIRSGTAEMVVAGESMQNWAPKAALIATPYAFDDADHVKRAIQGEIGKEIEEEIEEKVGLKPLYYHSRAPRNLTSKKPITNLAELKDFKMRVPNVPLFIEAWKAAGASPQALDFNEVFTGLQQGVIEGQENPVDLIHSGGLYEVQDYVNETEHVNGWVYVLVGVDQFNALSEEMQTAVLEAAEEAQVYADKLFVEETEMYRDLLEEAGMKFIEVNKEEIRGAMEPAIKKSLDEDQLKLYEKIGETR